MGPFEDARVALLSRLIDHAPLFPPASLELSDAIEEDRRARESPASFMLARFVCPASRLAELPDLGRGVSAVLDAPLDGAAVEAVETPATDDLQELRSLAQEVYVEVPLDDALEERLDALVEHGLCAKVRCGGAAVPDAAELARDAFTLADDGFRWRDCHAGPGELAHARRARLHSIGSCSFFEPVEELEALGVLPL